MDNHGVNTENIEVGKLLLLYIANLERLQVLTVQVLTKNSSDSLGDIHSDFIAMNIGRSG